MRQEGNEGYFSWRIYATPGQDELIETVKTTSVENVSTGVPDENKGHFSRCKFKAKIVWCIKTYTITYVKIPIK